MKNSSVNAVLRPLGILMLSLSVAAVGGCRTYHSFDRAQAQSAEVLEALAQNGEMIRANDDDDFRRERFRYIATVQEKVVEADEFRLEAMARRMSDSDARLVSGGLEMIYAHLHTLARLPARLKDDGSAADEETAALLKDAKEQLADLEW